MTGIELERYVMMYRHNVISTAVCCLGSLSDADDVMQDVFLKLYTYSGSFASDEHVKAWLLRCTVNRCRDIRKSFARRFTVPLSDAAEMPYYDSKDKDSGDLLPLVMKLNKKVRIAMYMHYYEGYTADEIGEMLGIGASAVRSRLMRGRNILKKMLTEERNGNIYGSQEDF